MKEAVRLLYRRAPAFSAHDGGVPFSDYRRRHSAERDVFECGHVKPQIAGAGLPVARTEFGIVTEPGPSIDAEGLISEFFV
jgi:hypothetical protein